MTKEACATPRDEVMAALERLEYALYPSADPATIRAFIERSQP